MGLRPCALNPSCFCDQVPRHSSLCGLEEGAGCPGKRVFLWVLGKRAPHPTPHVAVGIVS